MSDKFEIGPSQRTMEQAKPTRAEHQEKSTGAIPKVKSGGQLDSEPNQKTVKEKEGFFQKRQLRPRADQIDQPSGSNVVSQQNRRLENPKIEEESCHLPAQRPLLRLANRQGVFCYANQGMNALLSPSIYDFFRRHSPTSDLISAVRDLAICKPMKGRTKNTQLLRERLCDVVPSAKDFMKEVMQDSSEWLIQLMEGINKELIGKAKYEWLELTKLVLRTKIQCLECNRCSKPMLTEQTFIPLPVICDETGVVNLERHVDNFFSDYLDERKCDCEAKGGYQISSIIQHPQVLFIQIMRFEADSQYKIEDPISNGGEYSLNVYGEMYECVGILEHTDSSRIDRGHYNFVALSAPYSISGRAWLCSDNNAPIQIDPQRVRVIFERSYITVWERTRKGKSLVFTNPLQTASTEKTTSWSMGVPIPTLATATASIRVTEAAETKALIRMVDDGMSMARQVLQLLDM